MLHCSKMMRKHTFCNIKKHGDPGDLYLFISLKLQDRCIVWNFRNGAFMAAALALICMIALVVGGHNRNIAQTRNDVIFKFCTRIQFAGELCLENGKSITIGESRELCN